MTREEESCILDSIKSIRKKTDENNIMLKQIINYLNGVSARASEENANDFMMNVIANILSNRIN